MAKIISILIEAGGAGKSNTTLHTAWELAMQGKRVLMIDLDGQSGNLTFFSGIETSEDTFTMYDVLQRKKGIHSAILPVRNNLDIIPANQDVTEVSPQKSSIDRMMDVIKDVSDEYDYIFIDNNPDPTWRHALTLSVSNYVVVVMTGDFKSLEACKALLTSVDELSRVNPDIQIAGFLFNRFDGRLSVAKEVYSVASSMAENADTKVFHTIIRQDVLFTESSAIHIGITECAPKSRGAEDIRSFVKELLEGIEESKERSVSGDKDISEEEKE